MIPRGKHIVWLDDQLLAIAPSTVGALNRAVAVAEIDALEVALPIVETLTLS